MRIPCGKHKDKSVEWVVLKDPSYIQWVLNEPSPRGWLISFKQETLRLISIFDRKPFFKQCSRPDCGGIATRASLRKDNPKPMWWCDRCNPYDLILAPERIRIIYGYVEALLHIKHVCGGRKGDLNYLIHALAEAKGLPRRVGEKQARGFFELNLHCGVLTDEQSTNLWNRYTI